MNTHINFTHFRFAQPCFKNRQEMLELLGYKFEDFDYCEHEDKYHLFNLMEIEINEAIWKTANLMNSRKGAILKEYKKLKLVLAHLKHIQSNQIIRNVSCAHIKYRKKFGYFFHTDEYYESRNFFSINFDAFKRTVNRLEEQNNIPLDTTHHKSLNDDFKILGQSFADIALAELKAKMGL